MPKKQKYKIVDQNGYVYNIHDSKHAAEEEVSRLYRWLSTSSDRRYLIKPC